MNYHENTSKVEYVFQHTGSIIDINQRCRNLKYDKRDSMDLNIEIPVGETPVKVSFKATSTVASSIVAQERLNEIARDNINFLGSKIADGISYLMNNAYSWAHRIHEIEKLQKQWRDEERIAD